VEIEIRRHSPESPWTYETLLLRQEEVYQDVLLGKPGRILLSEVAPVITLGRRSEASDLSPFNQTVTLPVLRGGKATYHGPGQWVLFVVESLEKLTGDRRGVRKAVMGLLEVGKKTTQALGVSAQVRVGCEAGIWSESGKKLGSVGVQIKDGVLLHGLSLNIYPTRESFLGLSRPCGLDVKPGFISETASETLMEGAASALTQAVELQFFLDRKTALTEAWNPGYIQSPPLNSHVGS
jgi:lipoyl(octanoyl) transferase